MKLLLALALSLFVSVAFAQSVCTVTYGFESETMDGHDDGYGSVTIPAMPMDEVEFNHKSQMKVLSVMSKEQDASSKDAKKNKQANANEKPMYKTDVYEIRSCDGGPKVKVAAGSASIQGISYAGAVRIADEMLKQGKAINDRHRQRVAQGKTEAWDHSKAPTVKRNDVGVRVKD